MILLYLCLVFLLCSLYPSANCAKTASIPLKSRSSRKVSSSQSVFSYLKNWLESIYLIGDDDAFLPSISSGTESVTPFIKHFPAESIKEERYPIDRLKQNDQVYMKYIESKRYPAGRSALSQQIIRKLNLPNFMQEPVIRLKTWLELKGTSIWDAIRIIESPNFDGRQYKFLNELPRFYLKQRMLVPFEVFLKRFQYENESESLLDYDGDSVKIRSSTPFTNLIFSFLEPTYLKDPSVDPFFKILVETQSKAFESCEWMFFDTWIRCGTSAWRYLKLYFDHSSSSTKSYLLAYILTSPNYCGPATFELMKFIVSIESFDPNVRVPSIDIGNDPNILSEKTPLLHILVLNSKYSTTLLPPLLTCKYLDTSIPTGTIILSFKACEIVYVNEPIIFLAGALLNGWALFHLATHNQIISTIRTRDFLVFLFLHFIKLIWLSLYNLARQNYSPCLNKLS